MTNSWDRPHPPTKGDEREDDTYAAVGRVLSHWENIEVELSHHFALYVNKMWTDEGYDLYYKDGWGTNRRVRKLKNTAKNTLSAIPTKTPPKARVLS